VRVFSLSITYLLFGLLFSALPARADATFTPPNPSNHDIITAEFLVRGGCDTTIATVVNGSVVQTTVTVSNCVVLPAFYVPAQTMFGPLPANTYSYEIYEVLEDNPPELQSQQTLIVSFGPSSIPTLERGLAFVFMLALAVVAVLVLARRLIG
jgi:hypothetical protein